MIRLSIASNKSAHGVFGMVDELEHKYEVKVQTREGRQKLPDDVKSNPQRRRNDG